MRLTTGWFAFLVVLALPACLPKPTFEAVQKGKVELDASEKKALETLISRAGLAAKDVRVFKDDSDWYTNDTNGVLVEAGHAARLRIEETGLEKASEVTSLTHLTHLEISENQIATIESFPATLLELDLSHNKLEQIPDLKGLEKLEVLNLSYNTISKIEGLDDQAGLKQLNLGNNEIETMENLSGLTSLWSLRLTTNKISQIQGLDDLDALLSVELSQNQISSIEPLQAAKGLTSITIAGNELEGALDMSGFPGLERLDVRDNAITSIEGIEKLEKLQYLDAGGNSITKKPDGSAGIETAYFTGNPCESTPAKDTMPTSFSGSATSTRLKCISGKCTGSIGKLSGTYKLEGGGPGDVRVTLSVKTGQVKVYLEQTDGSAMSVTASSSAPVTIEGRTTDDAVFIEALNGTARDVSYKIDPL